MNIHLTDILSWDKSYRLKFINSISGYKGVHLIGTNSENGISNLGIFNSVVHINSDPPQIGFIMRPLTVERDTYNNIIETESFTINHVQKSFLKKAHYTSVKLNSNESEFEACNLKTEYIDDIKAPFVKESKIKIGLKLIEDIEIKANGSRLIVGEVQFINIEKDCVEEDGQLDFSVVNSIAVTGLNQYSSVNKFINYPYVRSSEFPNFNKKERPDNVVFDNDTQTYNSSLLPYGTNIGAPSITPFGVSTWKNKNINSFNHIFNNKIEQIKDDYTELIDEYNINELLYGANMSFEPIIGQTYHLFLKKNNTDHFLSLIHPDTWKSQTYKGSFQLNSDKTWIKVDSNTN
jgi:flavin reductase (DIM6/NTAB) family NADH-FMN oxidoreductase RutF